MATVHLRFQNPTRMQVDADPIAGFAVLRFDTIDGALALALDRVETERMIAELTRAHRRMIGASAKGWTTSKPATPPTDAPASA